MITNLYVSKTQATNNMSATGILPNTFQVTSDKLFFKGFDLTENDVGMDGTGDTPAIATKVTLLLYNRVGQQGEILSSIVYISVPHPIDDDDTVFGYEPGITFLNGAISSGWNLNKDVENFSYLNGIRPGNITLPQGKRSLFRESVNTLREDSMPAYIIGENTISRDGWYTIISIGVVNTNVPAANVEKGLWVYNSTDGQIYIAKQAHVATSTLENAENWHVLGEWAEDISLTLPLLNNYTYNPWVSRDILWLSTLDSIYKDSVIDYTKTLDPYSIYPSLKVRSRVITNYALNSQFANAQYVLQATDFLRTTYKYVGYDNY